jgi:hypothetical protein
VVSFGSLVLIRPAYTPMTVFLGKDVLPIQNAPKPAFGMVDGRMAMSFMTFRWYSGSYNGPTIKVHAGARRVLRGFVACIFFFRTGFFLLNQKKKGVLLKWTHIFFLVTFGGMSSLASTMRIIGDAVLGLIKPSLALDALTTFLDGGEALLPTKETVSALRTMMLRLVLKTDQGSALARDVCATLWILDTCKVADTDADADAGAGAGTGTSLASASAPPAADAVALQPPYLAALVLCLHTGLCRAVDSPPALPTLEDCRLVSCPRQAVGLASSRHPVTLVQVTEDMEGGRRWVYRMTATATACFAMSFHVHAETSAVRVTSKAASAASAASTDIVVGATSFNRPIIVHFSDGGEDKTSKYPSLGLGVGDALARRCVILQPDLNIDIHTVGAPMDGTDVQIFHLSCVRFGDGPLGSSVWSNNFMWTPSFAATPL